MQYNRTKIAEMVKTGRVTKGYTQTQLSELTRISLRSVQRIEKGEVEPRLYTLNILATELGFDLALAVLPQEVAQTSILALPAKKIGRPLQIILSIGVGLFILLACAAFLSQTQRFPETNFEYFSFWAAVVLVYMAVLWRVWK